MIRKHLILITILLFSLYSNAQGIIDIEIFPETIDNNDTVYAVAETWIQYNDCRLDSSLISYGCGAVSITAFYSSWFVEDSCIMKDTFELGTFANGYYVLDYNMLYPDWVTTDEFQTNFTVGTTSIYDTKKDHYSIFPNPSNGNIQIQADQKTKEVNILDINGKHIKRFDQKSFNKDISLDLPAGSYFYQIIQEKNHLSGKLIILP